jgi:hypothetical protein
MISLFAASFAPINQNSLTKFNLENIVSLGKIFLSRKILFGKKFFTQTKTEL